MQRSLAVLITYDLHAALKEKTVRVANNAVARK